MVEALLRDVRNAWRMLAAKKGWTTVAVLSLALGIGATTVVFSIVESVLLRPFPYPRPHEIVLIGSRVSATDLAAYRDQSATIGALGLFSRVEMKATEAGLPVATAAVSSDVFRVLGISPAFGPGFPPRDDFAIAVAGLGASLKDPAPSVVLLGHGFWQRRYGGDVSVVGRTLRLGGVLHEIVGVMPRGFFFPEPDVELWTPLGPLTAAGFTAVARLQPGVPVETARAEIDVISRRLDADRPAETGRAVVVTPIREAAVSGFQMVLWLLLGAVTLVLLIGCANVANLLLARSAARGKELAVRATLGASRPALVRQLVVESLCMAALGGVVAVGLAFGGLRAVRALGLVDIPRMEGATINLAVLAFAAVVSLATGLLAGVVPALKASRVNLTRSLKQGGHTSQSGSGRLRDSLVVAEVALAVLLLVGAGLLVRSAVAMSRIDWGFNPNGLAVVSIASEAPADLRQLITYVQELPDSRARLIEVVLPRLSALPNVRAVGVGSNMPLVRSVGLAVPSFEVGERVVADGAPVQSAVTAGRTLVTPGYLTALGVELRGRDFEERDDALAERVVVLSRTLARSLFPGREPIGQTVHFATLTRSLSDQIQRSRRLPRLLFAAGGSENIDDFEVTGATVHRVIGVVSDVRLTGDLAVDAAHPAVYVDARQFQDPFDDDQLGRLYGRPANALTGFAIRTDGPPGPAVEAARAAIAEHDPNLALAVAAPMRALVSQSLGGAGESGLILALATVFGALSILLAAAGIYGVISHAVSQRVHEIGVRMAIGARPRDVGVMVLVQGLRLVAIGLAIGLSGAWAGSRMLEARLYGVTPTDPTTFAGVTLFLLAIAVAACLVPARRAAQVDPLVATRAD